MECFVLVKRLDYNEFKNMGIYLTQEKAREAAEADLLSCVKERGKWEENILIYKFDDNDCPLEYYIEKHEMGEHINSKCTQFYLLNVEFCNHEFDENLGVYSTLKEAQERAIESIPSDCEGDFSEEGIKWEGEKIMYYTKEWNTLELIYQIQEFEVK